MSFMPSENLSILGRISPASGAGGNSGWISVADHAKFAAIGLIGASDHNINAKLEGATDAAGSGAADLAGYAITQIGNASVDNKEFMIELSAKALAGLGFTHFRFSIAGAGGAAALASGLVLGLEPYVAGPGIVRNAASVAQVVSVRP
jgi:hypothetical protein